MNKRPRLIKDFLQHTHTLHGLLEQSKAQLLLLQRVRSLIPSPLDSHCTAAVQKGTQLVLYVDSSTWASRLRFTTRDLARRLNDTGIATERITVRVLVTSAPAKRKPVRIRQLSPENASLINQTAAGIEDPELRQALIRLGRHADKTKP
ncbi:DciA family protein [Sedimenticola hydrogenitrophicus]|uniref:DciA family protein n=1 Tax=Sedimenticola hydrogenitrophicus TaxID=2967975 RepID=UPI0023AE83F1|nr:DciA family protein [Sedimenticola hydrogenitrophicus]